MNVRDRLERLDIAPNPPRQRERPAGGPLFVETCFPREYREGNEALSSHLPWLSRGLPGIITGREDIRMEDMVFLDVETTGLSGGVGNHVFMVGLGHAAHDGFHIVQFLLHDLSAEDDFLNAINDRLSAFRVALSFNGKCFDFPQIRTRMDYHRLSPRLPGDHVDLLHVARRLWRECLPACDLATLEREVLGIHRKGDIPGSLIPSFYFRYLFGHDPGALDPIISHNRKDVLSLFLLAGTISRILEEGPGTDTDPRHLFSLGKTLVRAGCFSRGSLYIENAIDKGLPHPLENRARLLLARHYRRLNRTGEAKRHLSCLCSQGGPADGFVELAKCLEHDDKDPLAALAIVERALHLGAEGRLRQDLEHRLRRLKDKSFPTLAL